MNIKHTGSCLCGHVQFEIEGSFEQFFLCHCRHCRKDTGSAHAANLFATHATLWWITGLDKITSFTLLQTRHTRSFCSICGSALPNMQAGGKLLAVPAGSLDTPIPNKPDAHIFMASRAAWDDHLETIPKLEKYPS